MNAGSNNRTKIKFVSAFNDRVLRDAMHVDAHTIFVEAQTRRSLIRSFATL
jgi:hypothetical protein